MLRGGIRRYPWRTYDSVHAANIDNGATALAPHQRNHGAANSNKAENIDLKNVSDCLDAGQVSSRSIHNEGKPT